MSFLQNVAFLVAFALVLFFLGAGVSGCMGTGSADALKTVVDEYCERSEEARALMRANSDMATAPHQVRVYCDGDLGTL